MDKITLKLYEFYNLEAELNGVTNQQTGEKLVAGLLQEKLSLTTKYWLTKLAKKVGEEKAIVEELKNELIKKYGKEDENGGVSIPMSIDELDEDGQPKKDLDKDGNWFTKKVLNPDFKQFETEFNALLQTDKELEYKPFSLEDFEKLETSENYATFFQLIKADAVPVVPMAAK
jgi:hypothetical protein